MSRIPSAAEIELIRSELEVMCMPDYGTILAVTEASDGAGGVSTSWASPASGTIKCRLDSVSGKKYLSGGFLDPYHSWMLTMPHDTTLTEDNRIAVNSGTYTIKSITGGSWLGVKRAELELIP